MKTEKVPRTKKLTAIVLDAMGELKQDEIVKLVGINKKTFQRAKKKYEEHGDVEGGVKKRGAKGKLHYNMKNVCLSTRSANEYSRGFFKWFSSVLTLLWKNMQWR